MTSKKKEELMLEQEQKSKQLQDLDNLLQLMSTNSENSEIEEEIDDFISAMTPRKDIPPPPQPEKNKYNPDGIYDIITVAEHPYFLGLTLTPWQKLTLKLCYMGTPGNINLKIENERTEDCSGCVWRKYKEQEERQCKAMIQDAMMIPNASIPDENSKCLQCTRFDCVLKNEKFKYLANQSTTPFEESIVDELSTRELKDNFYSEQDMIDYDLSPDVKQQLNGKIGRQFQEIIFVFGRRSGKSMLTSVISIYEVYRLICMGHPQRRFGLMDFDIISIINVAKSEKQAKSAIFDKIRILTESSPYFSKYIGKPPTQLEMYFLTENDKKENEKRTKIGLDSLTGTLCLMCGHSKSSTLLGYTCVVVIIDEMAVMAAESSEGIDYQLYELLKPSLANFGKHSKIICISNPMGPFGKFFDLYNTSFTNPTTLMVQLPTWKVNPTIELSWLHQQSLTDPTNYEMQYGAEFGTSAADPFVHPDLVYAAFENRKNQARLERGEPLFFYFCHVDPAYNSDNYSLAVCHAEPVSNIGIDGQNLQKIVVDHIHYFEPPGPKGSKFPINIDEVDQYIIQLCQRFKIQQMSFDHFWGSQASINKLKGYGVNVIMSAYNHNYKSVIYSELYNLFTSNLIEFYGLDSEYIKDGEVIHMKDATFAKEQFLILQRKFKNNSYKIEAIKGKLDDIPDAVAGAAFQALKHKVTARLPKIKSMYTRLY